MKFTKIKDGEWIAPKMRGYKLACCDCGLVHRLDFRIQDGIVVFRAQRMPVITRKNRRQKWAIKHRGKILIVLDSQTTKREASKHKLDKSDKIVAVLR